MASKSYELRVYTADGSGVDFTLTSLLAPPSLPGPLIDPVRGRTQTQSWTFRVADVAGAVTSRLADADGRVHLLGRLVEVRVSVDGGAMAVLGTGRLSGLTEADGPGEWTVRVDDERWVERNTKIFTKQYATAAVYPPSMSGAWAGLPAAIRSTTAATPVLLDTASSGSARRFQLVSWIRLSPSLASWIADDLVASPRPGRTDGAGNFNTLRLECDGVLYPIISFDKEFTGATFTDSLALVNPSAGRPLSAWVWDPTNAIATGPIIFPVRLVAPVAEPTEALPLHTGMEGVTYPYDATDPFQFVQDVYDEVGVRYDSAALTALKGRYPPLFIRATAPENTAQCLEDRVYGPLGVTAFVDEQGRVAPRSTRVHELSTAEYNALPELDASEVSAHPTMDISGRELVNEIAFRCASYRSAVSLERASEHFWDPRIIAVAASDFPADLLIAAEPVLTRSYASAGGAEKSEALQVDLRAFRFRHASQFDAAFGTSGGAAAEIADSFAQEVFERFGDGPIRGVFPAMAGAPALVPGDLVRLNQTSIKGANPASNARTGTRIVQILQRTLDVEGPTYDYLDIGPSAQPLAPPTVAVAQNAADPKHTVDVTLASVPPVAVAAVEISYASDFGEIVHRRTGLAAGVVQVGPVASGRTVYARAASSAPGRLTSGWGAADSVATEALSPPTGFAATADGTSAVGSWTIGEADYPVMPVLDAVDVLARPLPAGSVRYVWNNLSGTVDVGVKHVDAYGGVSTLATAAVVSGAAAQLDEPASVRVLQGRSSTSRVGLPPVDQITGYGIEIEIEPSEPIAGTRVQLSTSSVFASIDQDVTIEPGVRRVRLATVLDDVPRYMRCAHVADGFADSDFIGPVSARPTGLLRDYLTPPASEAVVTADDYRSDPALRIDYGSAITQVRVTVPGGRTKTWSGLTDGGSLTYVVGIALDDLTSEGTLVAGETREPYTVEIFVGASTRGRIVFHGPLHGLVDTTASDAGDPPIADIKYRVHLSDYDTGRYTLAGLLGDGATGPLQWRYRIDHENTGEGTPTAWVSSPALPEDLDVARDPLWGQQLWLEVRDANGQTAGRGVNVESEYTRDPKYRPQDALAEDSAGRKVNRFYGKQLIGDPDNFDGILDSATYKKTTANEKTGAARGFGGLNSSNRLVTGVEGSADIDGETASRVKGQALSPSQNLLHRDARTEKTASAEGEAASYVTLDEIGLTVGDIVSASAQVRVLTDGDVARAIKIRCLDGAGGFVAFLDGGESTASTIYTRLTIANKAVPVGTERLQVYIDNVGTAIGQFRVRFAMLNRGPVALPYEEPPLRPNREKLDDLDDGTTYKKTTGDEKTGAGRGFNALDTSNRLKTGWTAIATDTSGRLADRFFAKTLVGEPDNLDSVVEGTTFRRVLNSALTAGQPDLAKSGVINKSLAHIADDTSGDRRAATANEKTGGSRAFGALESGTVVKAAVQKKDNSGVTKYIVVSESRSEVLGALVTKIASGSCTAGDGMILRVAWTLSDETSWTGHELHVYRVEDGVMILTPILDTTSFATLSVDDEFDGQPYNKLGGGTQELSYIVRIVRDSDGAVMSEKQTSTFRHDHTLCA